MSSPAILRHAIGILVAFSAGWWLKPSQKIALAQSDAVARIPARPQGAPPLNPKATTPAAGALGSVGDVEALWQDGVADELAAIRAAASPGLLNAVFMSKLATALDDPNENSRTPHWQALLAAMRPEDATAVSDLLKQKQKEGRFYTNELSGFMNKWGVIDGSAAASMAVEAYPGRQDVLSSLMAGWGRSHPEAALAWIQSHPDRLDSERAIAGVIQGCGDKSAGDAEALLLAHAEDPAFINAFSKMTYLKIYQEGIPSARRWFEAVSQGQYPDAFKRENLTSLIGVIANSGEKSDSLAFVQSYLTAPWLNETSGIAIGNQLAQMPYPEALTQLETIASSEAKFSAAYHVFNKWGATDPGSLSIWLSENRQNILFDEGSMLLVKNIYATDPEGARIWADQITETTARTRALAIVGGLPDPDQPGRPDNGPRFIK